MKFKSSTFIMNSRTFALALAFAGLGTTLSAEAAPELASTRMPPKSVVSLKLQVSRARALDAKAFTRVSTIVRRAPDANAHARSGKGATAQKLAQLGLSALYPMLELLALEPPRGLDESQAKHVRRDLIEAVGLLRDARALPVLTVILENVTEDAATTRTAAEAVARIGNNEAAEKLLASLASSSGGRARSLVEGMGECRKLRVTEALATQLQRGDDDTARVAARSLGRAGNAWAWKTVGEKAEEAAIRRTAAKALVEAFVRRDGEARQAASNALMVVDAPETSEFIAMARQGSSVEVAKALDELAARFARNPTR